MNGQRRRLVRIRYSLVYRWNGSMVWSQKMAPGPELRSFEVGFGDGIGPWRPLGVACADGAGTSNPSTRDPGISEAPGPAHGKMRRGAVAKQVCGLALAALAGVCLVNVARGQSAKPVSRTVYAAMLKQANTEVTRAENPVVKALYSQSVPVAKLKAAMLVLAATDTRLGHRFAGVLPPGAAAQHANAMLSRAELHLGAETRALALHLPTKKTVVPAYLTRNNPKGGPELDKAIHALAAAGYHTSGS
jgi:hypothetical protein